MKNWEDIFKESLEDCSCSLPEGSLEEFQSKLSSPRRSAAGRLAWLALPAAAACAAVAVLMPWHGSGDALKGDSMTAEAVVPVQDVSLDNFVTPDNAVTVADAPDASGQAFPDPARSGNQTAQNSGKQTAALRSGNLTAQSVMPVDDDMPAAEDHGGRNVIVADEAVNAAAEDTFVARKTGNDVPESIVPEHVMPETVTWVELEKMSARRRRGGAKTATILGTGGGVLGGAAAGLLASVTKADNDMLADRFMSSAEGSAGAGYFATPVNSVIRTRHMMPVKAGVTVRYPLSERFYLMTGLEYSMYHSERERFLTGKEQQYAHYLGIPVRVDWSALKTKHLDLYLGAGFSADRCVHAVSAGSEIWGDKMNFSLLAAGGALVKLNRWAGLYLEPQFSWRALTSGDIETYRTEHPAMLGVSAGLRFTIGE